MGHYFGWVRVGGDEWGWVHCLIMPIIINVFTDVLQKLSVNFRIYSKQKKYKRNNKETQKIFYKE